MSRTLAAVYVATFGRPGGGTALWRSLARSLRRLAREHAIALAAAADAQQPRKGHKRLRRLYTQGA